MAAFTTVRREEKDDEGKNPENKCLWTTLLPPTRWAPFLTSKDMFFTENYHLHQGWSKSLLNFPSFTWRVKMLEFSLFWVDGRILWSATEGGDSFPDTFVIWKGTWDLLHYERVPKWPLLRNSCYPKKRFRCLSTAEGQVGHHSTRSSTPKKNLIDSATELLHPKKCIEETLDIIIQEQLQSWVCIRTKNGKRVPRVTLTGLWLALKMQKLGRERRENLV